MFNLTVVLILFFLFLLLWSLKKQYQKGEGWNIKFIADEQGNTLLPYALLLVLLAIFLSLGLVALAAIIQAILESVSNAIPS